MSKRINVLLAICAVVALQLWFPIASLAAEGDPVGQEGENRWVPSLAITSGVTVQNQKGTVDSVLFEDGSPTSVPLQGAFDGDDLAVSPLVGGSLEVMAPALPIPTRPRLFLSGELLPTFASDRKLALDGDPGCIHGPRVGDPCVNPDEDYGNAFKENDANGQGSSTSARVDTLVYGASVGVAFPARIGKRQLRIKPSFGWINYKVDAEGLVVDAACALYPDPSEVSGFLSQCVHTATDSRGFLRETTLTGSGSQRFNGIGPGLDLEMDTGRFGPLGVSLFLGARAYRVLGDRKIAFSASETFTFPDDELAVPGPDTAVADWEVEVDPWMYRAHVGIRFQWLGSGN